MVISVLVLDNEAIARKGLIALLKSNPAIGRVAEASSAAEAIEVCRAQSCQAIIYKLQSDGDASGLEHLRLALPGVGIMVLTTSCSGGSVMAAVRGGARGFVTTDIDMPGFIASLAAVARGDTAFSREAMLQIIDHLSLPKIGPQAMSEIGLRMNSKPRLTAREVEVLDLVSIGSSNRDIAERLVISEHTVRAHLRNILDKLRLDNRVQAAAWAVRVGLGNGHSKPVEIISAHNGMMPLARDAS